jgi:methylated-DNA-protein-cysteine methyltransferase-like protein
MTSDVYKRIYEQIKRIPQGRVATYGQIAMLARTSGPRQVGYALHALPEGHNVPWHRVINAQGRVSARSGSDHDELQRALLEAEGVRFDDRDRIALQEYRWEPRANSTHSIGTARRKRVTKHES